MMKTPNQLFVELDSRRLTRILSFDGGGIRGILAAYFLREAARKHAILQQIVGRCEMLAGTSTGALIACLLAHGKTLSEILGEYDTRCESIFAPYSAFLFGFGEGSCYLHHPKFCSEGIDAQLNDIFGDTTFGQLLIPTLVVAYNATLRKPVVFKSWCEDHQDLLVRDICRASSAAPGYFAPHAMKLRRPSNDSDPTFQMVDGGLAANNPALCAIAEAVRTKSEPHLLSFGTGARQIDATKLNGGIISWGEDNGLLDVALSAPNQCIDYIARMMLGDRYFRLDFDLNKEVPLDKTDVPTRQYLQQRAFAYLDEERGKEAIDFMYRLCCLMDGDEPTSSASIPIAG
jgi:patatin-like phospholipase/acyl hydrolase